MDNWEVTLSLYIGGGSGAEGLAFWYFFSSLLIVPFFSIPGIIVLYFLIALTFVLVVVDAEGCYCFFSSGSMEMRRC